MTQTPIHPKAPNAWNRHADDAVRLLVLLLAKQAARETGARLQTVKDEQDDHPKNQAPDVGWQ
jgi:hypothetical protein